MRVAIAGAGAVGRSIARELLENGHEVLLIDQKPSSIKVDSVPRAEWLLADACEISSLDDAALDRCNVVVAATGDDKVNLVVSLLAKTEYGVPRVVARVNHPGNEWLYNESWGVDVAVSTPRLLSALVEEAVSVGDLVRLMTFGHSEASLVELTLAADACGVVAGWFAQALAEPLSFHQFINSGFKGADFNDFLPPTFKTAVFGSIIGLIACYQGMSTKGGAAGVGRAATSSVVLSSLFVILADVVLVKIILIFFP